MFLFLFYLFFLALEQVHEGQVVQHFLSYMLSSCFLVLVSAFKNRLAKAEINKEWTEKILNKRQTKQYGNFLLHFGNNPFEFTIKNRGKKKKKENRLFEHFQLWLSFYNFRNQGNWGKKIVGKKKNLVRWAVRILLVPTFIVYNLLIYIEGS